jgi:hypothetical protein
VACSEEFPRLQKLIDEYKDCKDVQFISFNLDANPGLVEPFVKDHALSFVVVPAYNYVTEKLNVYVPVPSNWVVDGNGVVRLKGQGYDITGKWETGMKDAIEKVKALAAATSSAGTSP